MNSMFDLEFDLQHRRQPLPSIDETTISSDLHQHSTDFDIIYLRREHSFDSIFSIESQICLQGNLSWLISIFQRFTSNIFIQDDVFQSDSPKNIFSKTIPDDEQINETEIDHHHLSQSSSSPPLTTTSPIRRHFHPRSSTTHSLESESSFENINKTNYASILLPNMNIHQIFDALLRNGLEIIKVFSHVDSKQILHQTFLFKRTNSSIFKPPHHSLHRSTSNKGP